MMLNSKMVTFCFLATLFISLSGLPSTESDANADIITILNHIKEELRYLKQHAQLQDKRGNAAEKSVALLTSENVELKKTLDGLKEYAKEQIKDLKEEINHAREQVKDLKEDVTYAKEEVIQDLKAYVHEQVKDVKDDVNDVKRKIEGIDRIQHDIEIIKEVATGPLPGKTLEKPSESCSWLNQRYYNLPDGKYWTKVYGQPQYTKCSMNKAGIPPVRCASKPCHVNAVCEDIDEGVKCTCNCGYTGNGKECQKSFKPLTKGKGKMLLHETCSLNAKNHLTTFKHVAQDYLVRFEVYPTMFEATNTSSRNIVHFTTGENCCDIGQRIPAVWFFPNPNTLHLCSYVNGDGNYCQDGDDTKVPLHQWSRVEIKQQMIRNSSHIYSITINDVNVFNVVNTTPKEFKNIKLYVSDPWHHNQKGYIRNLYVEGYE